MARASSKRKEYRCMNMTIYLHQWIVHRYSSYQCQTGPAGNPLHTRISGIAMWRSLHYNSPSNLKNNGSFELFCEGQLISSCLYKKTADSIFHEESAPISPRQFRMTAIVWFLTCHHDEFFDIDLGSHLFAFKLWTYLF